MSDNTEKEKFGSGRKSKRQNNKRQRGSVKTKLRGVYNLEDLTDLTDELDDELWDEYNRDYDRVA